MSIAIGDEQLALQAAVRRFTTDRCTSAVTRAAIDAGDDQLPPYWDELAGLGWLGLHVEGFGFSEAAVVLEELGRVVAPGPMLPTMLAAALVRDGGGDPDLVADLAAGRRTGTVAFAPGPLLSGAVADVIVVPVGDGWGVAEASRLRVSPVESLDATRRLAEVAIDDAAADPLPTLTRARVDAVTATLVAAECAGGAGWCVETAAAYAKVRRQFGRPIGQFQAVKHRCADMLVAAEEARAAAWDAALALDTAGLDDGELALSTAAATATAIDAFVRVAKDCIQVLGGIGFTWEHDAHLYLRRAVAMSQLFGGATRWRARAAAAALDGARRRLSVDLPETAEALRAEVRAEIEEIAALPKERRRAALVERRLFVPHWPPPWGRDAGAVEQLVIDEELRRAKVRIPHLQVGAWAAPTIAVHGTPEQQERWVRPTLLGEIAWCQLFSEPEAGSDLASLRTRAERVEGGWRVNGQKVWTSMAREADWGICLVRTNADAPKHLGITYLVVDMRSPGIEIRPLREMTGMEMFNEVFFDDVFVPDDCVIGEVDGGWPLAKTTLGNERVAMGSGSSFGGGIEALLALVHDARLDRDALLLDRIGALVAEAHTLAVLGLRTTARSVSGAEPGPESSVRKLAGVEHDQRVQETGLSLLGPEGATTVGDAAQWTFGFLANRCLTIAGGTSEIQRNVIAERLLGLPRDPDPTEPSPRGL